MKQLDTIAAFGFGCMTAALVGWAVPHVRAQGSPDPSDAIHVCVAADGVVRLFELAATCPDGQKSLLLKKKTVDSDAPKPTEEEKKTDPACNDKEAADEIEKRLKALEDSPDRRLVGNRVVAPFEVVDRAGKQVFVVSTELGERVPSVRLFDSGGQNVASIVAKSRGGQFVAGTASGNLQMYLGMFNEGKGAGFVVAENGQDRIDLGRDGDSNNYRLKFLTNGKLVAGIGQHPKNGGGVALLSNANGKTRVEMGIGSGESEGKGFVAIANDSAVPLAALTEGSNGGGLLTLYGADHQPMVEAGVTAEGFGVVRAGPASFKPGMGLFGLPGSYISGKAK